MKKQLLSKTLLLLGLMLVGVGSAWAAETTESVTGSDFTSGKATTTNAEVAFTSSSSTYSFDGTTIKLNQNAKFTITASNDYVISSVVFHVTKSQTSTLSAETTGYSADGDQAVGDFTFNVESGKEATTVSFKTSSGKQLQLDKITLNLYKEDVVETGEDNKLTWSAESASVTFGETPYDLPILSNEYGLSIVYSSTDETVATIDADGIVTVNNATGSTIIKAKFSGNETYKAGTVSYTLNVTKAEAIEDGKFDFTGTLTYGSGMEPSTSTANTTTEKTWKAGNVTLVTAGSYRYWYNAKGNTLRLYNNTPASSVTLSVPSEYIITKIEVTGDGKASLKSEDEVFYNGEWKGLAQSVKLSSTSTSGVFIETITVTYEALPTTLTATVTSAGWATYAPKYAVEFREGTEAYIIDLADTEEAVLTKVTSVPAGTAVLLKGEGEHTMDVVASSTTDVSDNCLKVSDGMAKDDIYVLANGNYGVGFYRWIGESALSKGKIYLKPNAAVSRTFIRLPGADTTGIETIEHSILSIEHSAYDLQGRRVALPTKGLYIVKGKKFINK